MRKLNLYDNGMQMHGNRYTFDIHYCADYVNVLYAMGHDSVTCTYPCIHTEINNDNFMKHDYQREKDVLQPWNEACYIGTTCNYSL
jgi:hypothetical protein